jgi:hypothetical protein
MKMNHERRDKPKAETKKRPGKAEQALRRGAVIEFRVQSEEATPEEQSHRQTEEEENALEIALTAMTENHYHPEEREQRSGRQQNETEIEKQVHVPFPESLCRKEEQSNCQV